MSTIRLTNGNRDYIKKSLINNHFKKNIKPLIDKANDMASKLMLECYPKEVLEFQKKYPQFTNIRNSSVYPYKFVKDGNYRSCDRTILTVNNISVGLDGFEDGWGDKGFKNILGKNKEFVSLCQEIYDKYSKEIELDGKMSCILDSITTVNKLKDEFPEGYNAYYEIPPESKITSCDDIEKVRAELNSGSKKAKK